MKKVSVILILVLISAMLGGCAVKFNTSDVTATVTDKQYTPQTSTLIPIMVGKTMSMITQYHPESYMVTLQYKDVSSTIESEDLYKKVEKGQSVKVQYCEGTDKDGNITDKFLQLPQEK